MQRVRYGLQAQLLEQISQAGIGKELVHTCKAGVMAQAVRRNSTARLVSQLPAAVLIALGNAMQALVQIALDGAFVNTEFKCEVVFVDAIALVQAGNDLRQAPGKLSCLVW